MHYICIIYAIHYRLKFLIEKVTFKIVRKFRNNSNVFRKINKFIYYKKEKFYLFIYSRNFFKPIFHHLLEILIVQNKWS